MGPHEANLRGELALEQIRAVQEATWPGIQRDIEIGRVREVGDAAVVPVDDPLTRDGCAYGVRLSADVAAAPVAPNVVALPGRYRAWVLPLSGVAVALERLDDEDVYLRAYREHVLSLQGIADAASFARVATHAVEKRIVEKTPSANLVSFGGFDYLRVGSKLFSRLFVGIAYRRHAASFGRTIIEPVAPAIVETTMGPYR